MVERAPSAARRAPDGRTSAGCGQAGGAWSNERRVREFKKVLVILPMSACCCLPKMDDCGASFNVTGAERAFYLRVS